MGSARNLSRRFHVYYSLLSIEKILNTSKSHILSAILKYGYSKFTLEILEHCDSDKCLEREQYYIDLLNPEYNILKIAGSRLGSIQSEETKQKMSFSHKLLNRKGEKHPMFGKLWHEETRAKMSSYKAGEENPMFGKTGKKHPMFSKL